ncbi:GlxA family transcriptional regulator [Bosea vestrisii]|uniref:GlxA family transcriptional regulator n=1 Tax=Bosea vestrisii TaxID=151416 RepID=A0ABW0HFM1_9HYPH
MAAFNSVHGDSAPQVRLRVGFLLAHRFTLTAFSVFIDTLRLAADDGDLSRQILCRWSVMGTGGHPVRASCGIFVTPASGLLDPRGFDYIAVIGGLLHQGPQIDHEAEAYLRQAAGLGIPLVGVCTGSFILARAGLLDGRKCCVSWYHHQDMLREFDRVEPVSDRLFLMDGDRITSCGGAGTADLAAALVDRHVGGSAARKSLDVLLFDSPRAETSAQPLPAFLPTHASGAVRRAVGVMEQNLAEPLGIARLAERAGLSERQLDRLFRTELGRGPAATYRDMRLSYGRWLVHQSNRTIAEIAAMAGFADGAHFSKEFRKRFGEAPSQLRLRESSSDRGGLLSDYPADRRLY